MLLHAHEEQLWLQKANGKCWRRCGEMGTLVPCLGRGDAEWRSHLRKLNEPPSRRAHSSVHTLKEWGQALTQMLTGPGSPGRVYTACLRVIYTDSGMLFTHTEEGSQIPATIRTNLERILLSAVGFHWHALSTPGKSRETESKLEVTWGWGGGNGEFLLSRGFLFGVMKKFGNRGWWRLPTLWMWFTPWNCTDKNGNFHVTYILPQWKNLRRKRLAKGCFL